MKWLVHLKIEDVVVIP